MFFGPSIDYEQPIFRPPSEARSLLIQATIGCSNNHCTYCNMYRSKSYRVRSLEDITKDLLMASKHYQSMGKAPKRIFLCDGDALAAPTELLIGVLDKINELFPDLDRVGAYATAQNMLDKSQEELQELSKRKLNMAYLGLESGSDKVLHLVAKKNSAADMIEGALKIRKSGWKLSVITMLGLGGKEHSQEHMVETAKIVTQMQPEYFSFLTTVAVPETPYYKAVERGKISPLSTKELLNEMKYILENLSELPKGSALFRANHVSNQYPLGGVLPDQLPNLISTLDSWIQQCPEGIYPDLDPSHL